MARNEKHVTSFGTVFIELEMEEDKPTTDEYVYTEWLELKTYDVDRFLVFIKETGEVNDVKYKVQTTTVLADDGDEFDLKDKDGNSEWTLPAGEKDYQVVEEPWPKLRVGYKSAEIGLAGVVTIRTVAR